MNSDGRLAEESDTVRSIDVGEYMGYSKPSVSRAMGLLKKGGYITVNEDGYLHLTKEGQEIAEKIFERHTILTEFLTSIGVGKVIASEDACKMEHDISDESLNAIKKHIEKINR